MKRFFLTRAVAFSVLLALLLGLSLPWAGAIVYNGVPEITIEAKSALLVDLDTEQVLMEQDANELRYPASITKIMTCLLTLEAIAREELSMDTILTMPAEAFADLVPGSSSAGLVEGEEINIRDLLYCLMLPSANEAANALAIAVAGSTESFVERMNIRAQELGMTNTHFVNPHGLHDADHYSSAWDIYRMSREAMTHAPFREIVSTGRYEIGPTNKDSETKVLLNTNGLLSRYKHPGHVYSGTIGIKTGTTSQAGYCLVTACKRKGHTLVSVVLGAQNPTDKRGNPILMQFTESRRLLDWAFTNFSAATLLEEDKYLQEVPVRNSFQGRHVVIAPVREVKTLVPGEYDPERLELYLHLDKEEVTAPISKGDVLGTVDLVYAGQYYTSVGMAAVSDLSFSPFLAFVSNVNNVLGNLYVRLALLAAMVLVIIGVTRRYLSEQHQERKKARQAKRAARQKQAQARKEQTIREKAVYQARQEEKRRQAEEIRRKKEEEERERRRRELEQEQRQQDRERRRQEELDRRWRQQEQEEMARRWERKQARREQEVRERERRYADRRMQERNRRSNRWDQDHWD